MTIKKRFLDYQAEEEKKRVLESIRGSRAKRQGTKDSVEVLRELRGYEA